jgi:multicomponent Na+:H+ antiporter subunit E
MKRHGFHLQISLAITLLLFWLGLSGHYTPLLIGFGVLSVIGVVVLSHRMHMDDAEGHPIHLLLGAVTYWPWLGLEIAKSAWAVSRIILDPRLPISPTLVRVKPSQKTGVGVTTYANSITLTPGTISVEVDHGEILVHALTRAGAKDLEEGVMDRRVRRFEGSA